MYVVCGGDGTVSSDHPPFAVTVDLVVLTVADGALQVLLIQRGGEPFAGQWALPGGFVHIDEDLTAAAERELAEETGLAQPAGHLRQLATYGAPGRDPRGRVVTVAYLALLPDPPTLTAGTDAAAAQWRAVADLGSEQLAFDHDRIIADGVARLRSTLESIRLATDSWPPGFTVAQLRGYYEALQLPGSRRDPS
jgi:8-oxo-dGTP diphosphatase